MHLQAKQYDLSYDPRKEIVGDNYDDYSEKITETITTKDQMLSTEPT
jgi:hypothetical protein